MKELIEEATYLLITLCPEWVEGFGDCKKGSCTHCRVQKCISDLESLQSKGKTKEEVWKRFWVWYYAEPLPLDANRVFEWFWNEMESHANQNGWVKEHVKCATLCAGCEEDCIGREVYFTKPQP